MQFGSDCRLLLKFSKHNPSLFPVGVSVPFLGEFLMKVLKLSLMSAILMSGGFAIAGDEGQCDAKCATECKACPVTEGMAKLPQLVYQEIGRAHV